MTACTLGAAGVAGGARRAWCYAAAATALVLSGAPGHAAGKGGPPTLLSTITVTSTGQASWIDVRLNKAMKIADLQKTKAISVTGGGFVTVALLRTNAAATDAASLLFQRLPGEQAVRVISVGTPPGGTGFPAGAYRLFVVSDSATSMTIQLGAQGRGALTVRPKNVAKARNTMVAVSTVAGQTPPAAETHDTYTASKDFLVLAGAIFNFQTRHVLSVGSCSYDGDPPPATVGCPNGRRSSGSGDDLGSLQPQPNPAKIGYIGYAYSGPKKLTFGIDYATTGTLSSVTRWNTWIELS